MLTLKQTCDLLCLTENEVLKAIELGEIKVKVCNGVLEFPEVEVAMHLAKLANDTGNEKYKKNYERLGWHVKCWGLGGL